MNQISIFEHNDFLSTLAQHKDPLEKLDRAIDWDLFRPLLDDLLKKERLSNAGRKAFDSLMMLKVLVLQSLYSLSDAQAEFQILDRYTLKRFLCITTEADVPDEKTIWLFRERISEAGARKLFDKFAEEMDKAGLTAKQGSMIDATFVEAPRQRNSREENEIIKKGEKPEVWSDAKSRQKDLDARWTKKNNETHYGYKNHALVDAKHKLVREYTVTPANVHDSKELPGLLKKCKQNADKEVYADSAYRSKELEEKIEDEGLQSKVMEKGNRNAPLTEEQKSRNKAKSSIRVRVEHVFGRMKQFGSDKVRCIGKARAAMRIGLANLVYNLDRVALLGGLRPKAA
jgi:IS5 family transposase